MVVQSGLIQHFQRPILMIGAEGLVPKVRDSVIDTVNVIEN